MHLAMAAIVSIERWWEHPDGYLIGKAMSASHGAANPRDIADQLGVMRIERGL